MPNAIYNHENTAFKCALISMISLLVAVIFWGALMMTDNTLYVDLVTDSYSRKMAISMWSGLVSLVGRFLSLINVGGFIILFKNHIHSKGLYLLNSITPAVTVILYVISTTIGMTALLS